VKAAVAAAVFALSACRAPEAVAYSTFVMGGGDLPAQSTPYAWHFDVASLEADFVVALGIWVIANGFMLQRSHYGLAHTPRALVRDLNFVDAEVSVRCRPDVASAGGCGLLLRALDSENYYSAYAATHPHFGYLAKTENGRLTVLGRVPLPKASSHWRSIRLRATGTSLRASFDGATVSANESAFARGRVGLCTISGASATFDDLEAQAIAGPPAM
jgi:hypothetical protein